MVEVAQEIVGNAGGSRTTRTLRYRSASALYRHLVWLYLEGTSAAVVVVFFLAAMGLDFTLEQWGMLLSMTVPAVAFYVVPDIYRITRHFRPSRRAMELLDRGETPTREEASAAIVRALNLPYSSFVRVTVLHGPMATLAVFFALAGANYVLGA